MKMLHKMFSLVYYTVWINNEERVPLLQKHNSVGNTLHN